MPVIKGFRGQCPCPLWLLDLDDAVIVPLARRDRRQANPLYDAPPDSRPVGNCVEEHCSDAMLGSDFRACYARGAYYVCAKVNRPNIGNGTVGETTEAYINIWTGRSLDSSERGCLFCGLVYERELIHRCLCGWCRPQWMVRGWICPCFHCT